MIKNEHEKFLDLIIEYYTCRENWLEKNTRINHLRYRRVLKEIRAHTKIMIDKVQEINAHKLRVNQESLEKTGTLKRKSKPIDL